MFRALGCCLTKEKGKDTEKGQAMGKEKGREIEKEREREKGQGKERQKETEKARGKEKPTKAKSQQKPKANTKPPKANRSHQKSTKRVGTLIRMSFLILGFLFGWSVWFSMGAALQVEILSRRVIKSKECNRKLKREMSM